MRRRWSRASRLYLASSAILALTAGVALHAYLGRVASAAGVVGPLVPVVVASSEISRGSVLRSEQLHIVRTPKAYAQPGSLSRVAEASGRVALSDLAPGEAVTMSRLARVRAGPVASLIPEGLRAFAVPTTLPRGALEPGDRVDVLATFSSGQAHTETIVAAVEVLFVLGPSNSSAGSALRAGGRSVTADVGLDAAGAGASAPTTLLVLVSEEQERRLAFARAFADLEVAIAPIQAPP